MNVEPRFKDRSDPPAKKRRPLKAKRKTSRARPDEPMADRCDICGGPNPTERHHRLRRSQGGTDDRSNTLDLCQGCHAEVHANPAHSYEQGYLIRSST